MTTLEKALIAGGAAFGVYWFFFRNRTAGAPAAAGLTMPGGNAVLPGSYPGGLGLPSSTALPSAVYVPGSQSFLPAKTNDAPNATGAAPASTFGSIGSPSVLAGHLGSALIPGVSAGTGTAASPIDQKILDAYAANPGAFKVGSKNFTRLQQVLAGQIIQ